MPVTLEDIKDLSDEVNALVKAGLPLEHHLADAGRGHSARLAGLTESLSQRLAAGESLESAVREAGAGASRMLTAAVAAGIRSGQLGESIELLGDLANDLVELRRRIVQAIAYPLTVVIVALLLFSFYIRVFLVQVQHVLSDPTHQGAQSGVEYLIELDQRYSWWPAVLPVIGLVIAGGWAVSGRASSMAFRGPEKFLFLIPGVSGLVRDLRFYVVTRSLSLLTDRQLPLSESLTLAGACSGDLTLDRACTRAAAKIRNGESPREPDHARWKPGMLPPLLNAALQQKSEGGGRLSAQLRSVSDFYRRRLNVGTLWLKNVVPVVMFLLIGGGTMSLYALTVFWPVSEMYQRLSQH
ncbi:MAG: type II secretion system F family protein [Fuerstiella sp.]